MNHALKVLEFDRIQERLAKEAETELGQGYCLNLEPLYEEDAVWQLLSETQEAIQLITLAAPPSLFALINLQAELEFVQKGGQLGGKEIIAIGNAIRATRLLRQYFERHQPHVQLLKDLSMGLPVLAKLEDQVFASIAGDGEVLDSASPLLAETRRLIVQSRQRIVERIQAHASGKYRDYLSDPIYTSRFGRYVLPVKAEHKGKVKGIVHDSSSSGATLYVEPEDILEMGNRVRSLEGTEREEVQRVLTVLSGKVGSEAGRISAGMLAASQIDFVFAKARLSIEFRGNMPNKGTRGSIELEGARYPLLAEQSVVPLDIKVSHYENLVVTGPNTGGKTVAIKNVGIAAAMAQCGIFPKARHCKLGPFSGIFADIGDEQSLQQSLSTFSGHIRNVASALATAEPYALVLIDELGAGTDPAEGSALAKAILIEFQRKECAILASSHFGELKAFAFETKGFSNASMEFDSKSLSPTYRLIMGAAGASHAFKIAEKYGLPKRVVEDAKVQIDQGQVQISQLMEELDLAAKRARNAQSAADREAALLQKQLAEASATRQSLEELQSNLRAKTMQDLEVALRQVRLEANRVLDEARGKLSSSDIQKLKTEVGNLESKARKKLGRLNLGGLPQRQSTTAPKAYQVGEFVKVLRFNQTGTLLEVSSQEGLVQVGALKIRLNLAEIEPAPSPARALTGNRQLSEMKLQKAFSVSPEITIRKMRVDQAELVLMKYLDDAVLAGLDRVRIVHGKGEGILRSVTESILRSHPQISRFYRGDATEGGDGVTIAVIK